MDRRSGRAVSRTGPSRDRGCPSAGTPPRNAGRRAASRLALGTRRRTPLVLRQAAASEAYTIQSSPYRLVTNLGSFPCIWPSTCEDSTPINSPTGGSRVLPGISPGPRPTQLDVTFRKPVSSSATWRWLGDQNRAETRGRFGVRADLPLGGAAGCGARALVVAVLSEVVIAAPVGRSRAAQRPAPSRVTYLRTAVWWAGNTTCADLPLLSWMVSAAARVRVTAMNSSPDATG